MFSSVLSDRDIAQDDVHQMIDAVGIQIFISRLVTDIKTVTDL